MKATIKTTAGDSEVLILRRREYWGNRPIGFRGIVRVPATISSYQADACRVHKEHAMEDAIALAREIAENNGGTLVF